MAPVRNPLAGLDTPPRTVGRFRPRLALNCREFAPGVWRSAQPRPRDLRAFAAAGGRSVVSLRAGRGVSALGPEIETCRSLGLAFHRVPLRGHRLPEAAELLAAAGLFRSLARPVLLHCGSGADRAGFAASLWLALVEGRPVHEARRELSWRHGHNPLGRAGLLDAFFDACEEEAPVGAMSLERWLKERYDPDAVTQHWRSKGLLRRLRDRLGG